MLDVFQELAEEAHKQPSTLEGLANIVDAPPQYAFTQQELDNKFRGTSNADLRNKISQLETNLAKGALKFRDNGDKLRKLLEMHKQELERRAACSPGTTGWAHRAKHEQRWVNQYGVPEPTPSVPEPKPNPRVREANPSAVLDAYGSLDNSDDDFQPSRADQRRTGPTAAVPRMTKNGSSRAQGMVALSANGGTGSGTGKRRGGVPGLDAARAATHRLGGMHNGLGASQRFPGKPQLLLPGRLTLQRSTRSNDEKVDCTGCDKKGLIKAETYQGDGGIFLCRTCAADQFDVPPSGQLDCDTRHITAPQLKRSGAAPRSTGDFYGQANGAPAVKPGGAGRRAGRPAASRAAGRAKPKEDSTVIEISDDDEPGSGSGSGDVTASDREAVGGPPPRRSHRIGQHRTTTQRFEGLKALYPKEGGLTSVEITGGDMIRLDPEEFLNDTIIDFYIKFVQDEICKLPGGEAILDQCYFFNSFFYKKLTEKSGDGPKKGPAWNQANHARVKKWTKDQDIFSKRFLFVPIHEALHWSLFVICNPGLVAPTAEDSPCMLHLDSMGGCHPTVTIATNLLSYLQLEWQRKIEEGKAGGARSTAFEWAEAEEAVGASAVREFSKATFLHKRLPVPQQDNHCDCGLFLLAYLHYFLHSLPAHIHVNTADKLQDTHAYPNFLGQDWFQAGNASRLRQHIRHVIFRLFADQCRGRAELADALGEVDAEVDSFKALLASGGPTFVPPQDYRYQGEEAQRERIKREQAAAQRKAEQEAAKAAKKAELDAAKAEKKAAERVANGERKKRRREEAGRDRSPQEEDIFVELSSQEQGDTPPQRPTKQLRASLEGGARPLTQAAPRMDSVDLTDGAAEGGSRGDAAGDGSLERDPDFETAPDACALTDSDVEDDEQGGMAALGKRRSGRKRRSTEKAKEAVAAGDLTGGGAGQEEAGNDLAAAKKRRKKWRVLDDERLPGGEQEEAAQQDNGDVRFVAERRASLAGATTTSATAIVRGRILEHARGRFEKARRADLQVAPIGLPPKYDAHFTLLRMEGGAPHVQIWSHADVGTCEDLSTQRPAATFDTPEQAMAWLDRHCGAQAPRQGQPAGSPLDVEECHDLTGADDMEVPDSQPDGVGAAGMESELRDTHPSAAAAANAEPEVPEGWDQWRPGMPRAHWQPDLPDSQLPHPAASETDDDLGEDEEGDAVDVTQDADDQHMADGAGGAAEELVADADPEPDDLGHASEPARGDVPLPVPMIGFKSAGRDQPRPTHLRCNEDGEPVASDSDADAQRQPITQPPSPASPMDHDALDQQIDPAQSSASPAGRQSPRGVRSSVHGMRQRCGELDAAKQVQQRGQQAEQPQQHNLQPSAHESAPASGMEALTVYDSDSGGDGGSGTFRLKKHTPKPGVKASKQGKAQAGHGGSAGEANLEHSTHKRQAKQGHKHQRGRHAHQQQQHQLSPGSTENLTQWPPGAPAAAPATKAGSGPGSAPPWLAGGTSAAPAHANRHSSNGTMPASSRAAPTKLAFVQKFRMHANPSSYKAHQTAPAARATANAEDPVPVVDDGDDGCDVEVIAEDAAAPGNHASDRSAARSLAQPHTAEGASASGNHATNGGAARSPAQQLFVEAAHPPQAGDQQQRQEAAPAFRRPAKDPGAIPGFRDTSSEEDEDVTPPDAATHGSPGLQAGDAAGSPQQRLKSSHPIKPHSSPRHGRPAGAVSLQQAQHAQQGPGSPQRSKHAQPAHSSPSAQRAQQHRPPAKLQQQDIPLIIPDSQPEPNAEVQHAAPSWISILGNVHRGLVAGSTTAEDGSGGAAAGAAAEPGGRQGRVQHAAGSSAPKEHKHRAKRSAGDHAADALDLTGSAPADGLCSGHGTVIECRGVSGGEANPLGDATTTPGHQQELDDALLARRLQEQEDLQAASAQRGFTSGPADSKPTRTLKAGQASSPGKQAKQRRKSKPETLPDPTQRTLHGFLGPSS